MGKIILSILFFMPLGANGQSFHFTKIVNNKGDTINQSGFFLVKDDSKASEYTLFVEGAFAKSEFSNISFLVYDNRVFVKTNDLVYFKDFIEADYFLLYNKSINIISNHGSFWFLK